MTLPDLTDRTVVITGASRGLGAGMAAEMARHGVRLGLCARSAPALPAGDRVHAAALDVSDEAAVEAFAAAVAERLGPVDLWINNAGVLEPIAPLREVSGAALRRQLEVNVLGAFHGSRAYARHVRASGRGGVLVNISSGAARNAYVGLGPYCASKAALDRMTEVLALEEREAGLRVHAVYPGIVDTGMQELIRSCPPERFPTVGKFLDIAERDAFNSPAFVARCLLELAFVPGAAPSDVVWRVPDERG